MNQSTRQQTVLTAFNTVLRIPQNARAYDLRDDKPTMVTCHPQTKFRIHTSSYIEIWIAKAPYVQIQFETDGADRADAWRFNMFSNGDEILFFERHAAPLFEHRAAIKIKAPYDLLYLDLSLHHNAYITSDICPRLLKLRARGNSCMNGQANNLFIQGNGANHINMAMIPHRTENNLTGDLGNLCLFASAGQYIVRGSYNNALYHLHGTGGKTTVIHKGKASGRDLILAHDIGTQNHWIQAGSSASIKQLILPEPTPPDALFLHEQLIKLSQGIKAHTPSPRQIPPPR